MNNELPVDYIITCHVPICPICGGALHNHYEKTLYVCNDCKTTLQVIDRGRSEYEMVCHIIPKEK